MLTAVLVVAMCHASADHPGAVASAAADLLNPQKVPPFLRQEVRYLDFSDVPKEMLAKTVKVLCGHVNQLSRNALIKVPQMATPTLMRLYIRDYHWKKQVWESLKDSDPHFHVTLVLDPKKDNAWPGGVWAKEGKYYAPGAFRATSSAPGKKTVLAVQLHTPQEVISLVAGKITEAETSIGKLVEYTQSQVPIVDAVWFFQQTVTDIDRKPGYHDFLGFQDKKEFDALLGFQEAESRKFSDLWAEAVARSGVIAGKRARRIERFDKPGGSYWATKDSNLTKDRNNPLRVLDDALLFDAQEVFGPLANGMMAWGLFDSKGVRQDRAPDTIAGTKRGSANDTKILNCITCIECHFNAGVKDFSPWARTLFRKPKGLESADYDELLKLERRYLDPLVDGIEDTRRVYQRAIFRSTGFSPEEWSTEAYALWTWYVAAEVDLAWASRSLGVKPEAFQKALQEIKRKTGIIDPVLATFLEPPGESIAIDAWEEVFPIAQAYLRGFVP